MTSFPRRLARLEISEERLRAVLGLPAGVALLDCYPSPTDAGGRVFRLTIAAAELPELDRGETIPPGELVDGRVRLAGESDR